MLFLRTITSLPCVTGATPWRCEFSINREALLLAVLATMAKQEAKPLSEQVIAGGARPPPRTPRGRPRVDAETERAIKRLLRRGMGINKTTATVGVGVATVQRIRALMGPFRARRRSAIFAQLPRQIKQTNRAESGRPSTSPRAKR
jgi:hypothetical protein